MSRPAIALVFAASLALAGCGRTLTTEKRTYDTYGLLNAGRKSESVCYETSIDNVIWSVILIETVIAPVYFLGFSIMNPIRLKTGPSDTCGEMP